MKLNRTLGVLSAAALALSLAACGGDPTDTSSGSDSGSTSSSKSIVVGSAAFGESEILAEVYAQALKAKGVDASTKLDIGAREAYIGAIKDGTIDLIPEYTGNLLLYFDQNATATAPADVESALQGALPDGLAVLDPAPGEDKDSLNVTSEFAQKNGVASIADLAKIKGLKVAANPEFKTRAYGLPGMDKIYGIKDVSFTAISDGGGPATLKALTSGQVDVADIYSTTPSITQNKLVTLEDPKNLIAAQNVVPLIRDDAQSDEVKSTLAAVSEKLTTDALLELNTAFAADSKPTAADVAKDWLQKNGLV
ncbi:osmoprotectant transport system substrate-binding protein [Nocardioides terrae]|uniref:Osmoprotectant transport system substrate-binding protein n=1 Tax=Nocardioides terrae TaxID=574651 RepID=A0A1I1DNS4_9ACTN|nr:ABC transporter substrate-binding protein [Nocardioides terrae]SFB76531.1 osmoprotectant transport system substrate-binding protein [Nocardioides terrae]